MMAAKTKVQTQRAVTNVIQLPAKRLLEWEERLRARRIKECNSLQPIEKGRKTQIAALFIDDAEDAPQFVEKPPTMKQVCSSPRSSPNLQWPKTTITG